MIFKKQTQDERLIERAQKLHEAGKTKDEILREFSDAERAEAVAVISLIAALEERGSVAGRVVPDEASFRRMLSVIPNPPVTKSEYIRYTDMSSSDRGQIISLFNPIQSIMRINWKIIASVAVLVLIVVAYAGGMFGGSRTGGDLAVEVSENGTTADGTPLPTPPAPTGNVDAVVDALLADAAAESTLAFSDDALALVDADSQVINSLGQYNAYDF